MGLSHLHRRFSAWLALLALLLGTLAPAVTQAVAAGSERAGWVQICSVSGMSWVQIDAGDSGPAVDWIHDRLRDRAGLQSAEAGPAVLDTDSIEAVRRLQDANGLVPDGVIGPETLMALAARENEGPRLRRVLD